MGKTIYRTFDTFDGNKNVEKEWFEICNKKALKCGLKTERLINENHEIRLYMCGTKMQLFKYYIITIKECESKIRHIGRCIKILF